MSDYKIRKPTSKDVQFGQTLLSIRVGYGLPPVEELSEELEQMRDVLFGREDSPISSPYLALHEVATAYFCRASEVEMLIHKAERVGDVQRGSQLNRFRNGELRDFLELSKACANLGSRRLTQEQLLANLRDT